MHLSSSIELCTYNLFPMKAKLIGLFTCAFFVQIFAQNKLSITESESLFLKNNLYLLANHYNIDISEAQILQAKIWDNPQFGLEVNAWAPNNEQKFFNVNQQGQKSAYIQQLIHIGGQRKNAIELAKSNAKLANYDFEILLRELKFQLRQSYFEIYFDTKSVQELDKQLINIKSVVNAYSEQNKKGNISLKDLVRLQNLQLNLQKNRAEIINNINENKKSLNLLLGYSGQENLVLEPSIDEIKTYEKEVFGDLTNLQKAALENRPDFKKATTQIENASINLKLQKSLAIPDLTLGASYDQRGGAFNNQTNLTLAFPLPLWNKNKGNIKSAKFEVDQAEQQKEIVTLEVKNEVKLALDKFQEQKTNFQITKTEIPSNLDTVYQGVYNNFIKRNISLLEFTDFLESYNESMISINNIKKAYLKTCEELNYTTASKIF